MQSFCIFICIYALFGYFLPTLCTLQLMLHYVFIMFSSLYSKRTKNTQKIFLKKISKKCWHYSGAVLFLVQQNKTTTKHQRKKKIEKVLTNWKECVTLNSVKENERQGKQNGYIRNDWRYGYSGIDVNSAENLFKRLKKNWKTSKKVLTSSKQYATM